MSGALQVAVTASRDTELAPDCELPTVLVSVYILRQEQQPIRRGERRLFPPALPRLLFIPCPLSEFFARHPEWRDSQTSLYGASHCADDR